MVILMVMLSMLLLMVMFSMLILEVEVAISEAEELVVDVSVAVVVDLVPIFSADMSQNWT
jgi:hypothetical protein